MTRNEAIRKLETLAGVVPNFSEAVAVWLQTTDTEGLSTFDLLNVLSTNVRDMRLLAVHRRAQLKNNKPAPLPVPKPAPTPPQAQPPRRPRKKVAA